MASTPGRSRGESCAGRDGRRIDERFEDLVFGFWSWEHFPIRGIRGGSRAGPTRAEAVPSGLRGPGGGDLDGANRGRAARASIRPQGGFDAVGGQLPEEVRGRTGG